MINLKVYLLRDVYCLSTDNWHNCVKFQKYQFAKFYQIQEVLCLFCKIFEVSRFRYTHQSKEMSEKEHKLKGKDSINMVE